MTATPWFPDLLARWYDAFEPHYLEPAVDKWRYTRPRLIDEWAADLLDDPHSAAFRIDSKIQGLSGTKQQERRYRALQAACESIRRAGLTQVAHHAGQGWQVMRAHWREHGNLVKNAAGFLLPKRLRPYPWQGSRPEPKIYDVGSLFDSFLRPVAPSGVEIRIRTTPGGMFPVESLRDRLRVAVAPMIRSIDDLSFEPIDDDAGRRAFRVFPQDANRAVRAAYRAVQRAGRLRCDVLLLPELCLTDKGHDALRKALARLTIRSGGLPWLVVAGSASTPAPGGRYYNRALVLDAHGNEVLSHNKLFPYEMSTRESDRYGIAEALGSEPRVEDIVVVPRRLDLLECELGRTAVLICEDLSNMTTFSTIVTAFEIDWLLVPVMDGAQNGTRWTARCSKRYSEDSGVSVLVGTCRALVDAHRGSAKKNGEPDPGDGCAILTQRVRWAARVTPVPLGVPRQDLSVIEITGL